MSGTHTSSSQEHELGKPHYDRETQQADHDPVQEIVESLLQNFQEVEQYMKRHEREVHGE